MSISILQDWVQLAQLIGNHEGVPTLVGVDENGNLIALIKDPVSGNYVSVDASGYLTTVMKGTYGATLKTIAVDENGNLIALIKDPVSGNYVSVDASGYLTTVMKGTDGATLRTIAVDTNGNIVGVFKGQYKGEYKTLQTDSEGRLIAILTDPEDTWGVFRNMGLAELSSRLIPILAHDKRGDVIWYTDFRDYLSGVNVGSEPSGGEALLVADGTYMAPLCLKLKSLQQNGAYAFVNRMQSVPSISPYGWTSIFSLGEVGGILHMYIRVYYQGYFYSSAIEFNTADNKLYYLNQNGNMTYFYTINKLFGNLNVYHMAKMVVDWYNQKYVRLIIDKNEIDMRNYSLHKTTTTIGDLVKCETRAVGSATMYNLIRVGGLILTHNEH